MNLLEEPLASSWIYLFTQQKYSNNASLSSEVSFTSWGEVAFLVLVGHPSSNGVTVKILYGLDVLLHQ